MNKLTAATTAVVALAGAVVWAQVAKPAQQPIVPEKKADRASAKVWDIQFDKLEHNEDTGIGDAFNVVAVSDQGSIIHADHWKWNDKRKTAQATGNMNLTDEQADATAETADITYAKRERVMVLSGKVTLLLKPKKSEKLPADVAPAAVKVDPATGSAKVETTPKKDDEPESPRNHPIEITCDKVEYHYARDKRYAKLTGSFKAVQKLKETTRTLTADFAEWFGNDDRILLHGPVFSEDTKGRKGETKENVTISTKEGAETLTLGKGKYTFTVEDEDEPTPSGKPADTAKPKESPKPPK